MLQGKKRSHVRLINENTNQICCDLYRPHSEVFEPAAAKVSCSYQHRYILQKLFYDSFRDVADDLSLP